jgi:Zn-dependent protease
MGFLDQLASSPQTALIFLLAIVVAISIHEFAHAWMAYRLGDDTPYHQGRVTLNPMAHLDPLGSLAFLLFHFGWGRPVQYNPNNLSRQTDELLVALAGPASNLLTALGLNTLALLVISMETPVFNPQILSTVAGINVLLAAFNMLPIPPLDGSSIVAYFWPEYRSLLGGQIGLIVLLLVIFFPIPGYGSLLTLLLNPVLTAFAQITSLFGLLPPPGVIL